MHDTRPQIVLYYSSSTNTAVGYVQLIDNYRPVWDASCTCHLVTVPHHFVVAQVEMPIHT